MASGRLRPFLGWNEQGFVLLGWFFLHGDPPAAPPVELRVQVTKKGRLAVEQQQLTREEARPGSCRRSVERPFLRGHSSGGATLLSQQRGQGVLATTRGIQGPGHRAGKQVVPFCTVWRDSRQEWGLPVLTASAV